jgi:hypothetical protein
MRYRAIMGIRLGPNLRRRVQNERAPAELLRDVTCRDPTPAEIYVQPSTSHCGMLAEPVG